MKRILALLLALMMAFGLFACGVVPAELQITDPLPLQTEPSDSGLQETEPEQTEVLLDPDGWYYSAEDVALYLITYGELPVNFITKREARELGWEGGSVQKFLEGAAIGGDKFGNREGLLPKGKQYYECDIDYEGGHRNAKRIVYSKDGYIYYTEDHYESFEQLYP